MRQGDCWSKWDSYYTVQQGECLSSIARKCGFPDYATLYRDPENAAFRKKRPNPNVICPGDVLFIPDRAVKEIPSATDQQHQFTLTKKRSICGSVFGTISINRTQIRNTG